MEEGNKAKITLRFRGRELAHQELGAEMLKRLEHDLKNYGVVEQYPRMEGKQMVMVFNPKPGLSKPAKSEKPAPKTEAPKTIKVKAEPKTKIAT